MPGVSPSGERLRSASPHRLTGILVPALLVIGHTRPVGAQVPGSDSVTEPTASIGGLIVNARTRLPVHGAVVEIEGTPGRATTGPDGYFVLEGLEPGERMLEISIRGRVTKPHAVELEARRLTSIRAVIVVPEDPQPTRESIVSLPPLEVEIRRSDGVGKLRSYYRRRLSGRGEFLTREDLERVAPVRTSDLLRTVHGLRVNDPSLGLGVVRSNRGCVLPFFLDGLPAPGMNPDEIAPQDIDGIEIYRSSIETPAIFRGFGGCGALAIWTRDPGTS